MSVLTTNDKEIFAFDLMVVIILLTGVIGSKLTLTPILNGIGSLALFILLKKYIDDLYKNKKEIK